jgi:hypothetical protein
VCVTRSDGQPAAGAMVSVPRSSTPVPELALVADSAGVVRIRLPSGRFTLEAFTEDGGSGSTDIVVDDDRPQVVDVRIQGGGQ